MTEGGPQRECAQFDERRLELRNRWLAHAAVSTAQGILLERYHLASMQEAFDLLRETSQRCNVKLHTLADAVVRAPSPQGRAVAWFPGRGRSAPPPLPQLDVDASREQTRSAVLQAALERVVQITQTDMGDVQLVESGMLRLDKHTGLNQYFTDFFAFVDGATTSCAQAAVRRQQVTVPDVAAATVFDEESRAAILQAGSHACHSVPLINESGVLTGVVSSHHATPLTGFTRAQIDAMRETGTAVGNWLSWYRRTVVLDALEHLHQIAGRRVT
ncbi:GAF and ANTAR domain-containing protein [Streptomyces anandii]|uniref:GAF and ANTAR domain-containing protein n=1 Tax=Streptomyces anandii TaxID=285454 RepID=UPI0036FF2D61